MKIALLSDIHSNLEAFHAVKNSIGTHGADKIIFIGDVVGYGANPNECIELLRGMTDIMVAGNHDFAAVGKTDISYFNPNARDALLWTTHELTRENTLFLSSLPLHGVMDDIFFVHSTPYHPELWDYVLSMAAAVRSFADCPTPLCFIGHSHSPVIFVKDRANKISAEMTSTIPVKKDVRYIINIGSVGQPRDGNPLSSYGLYDTETRKYTLIRVPYDMQTAQQKILAAGLPRFLAERLSLGH